MKWVKLGALLVCACLWAGCASYRTQETDDANIPTVAERDPIIDLEARRNQK